MARRLVACAVVAACALMGIGFGSAAAGAATTTPKTALAYGDSITFESRFAAAQQMKLKKGWTFLSHSLGGTAVCDWLPWLEADLEAYHPSVVSIETAGNFKRPCMVDASGQQIVAGSPAYYDKYRADLASFFALATGTGARVVFVTAPPMADPDWNTRIKNLRAIATQLAGSYHGVSIANAPRNAVSRNGAYTTTKPCLATETITQGCGLPGPGLIYVRTITGAQTGIHLCPGGLDSVYPYPCLSYGGTNYSSGEWRFGKSLANNLVLPPPPILP